MDSTDKEKLVTPVAPEREPGLRIALGALLVLVWLAALILTAELGVRLMSPDFILLRPLLYYHDQDLPSHSPLSNPEAIYGLRPGSRNVYRDGRVVTVNEFGFRDGPRTAAKPDGVTRIIICGSSNLYGAAVSDNQTLPYYLEQLLNERFSGRFEVWNGGVSAQPLAQVLASAEDYLRKYSPDLLIVNHGTDSRRAFLYGEDFRGYFIRNPRLYLENLRFFPFYRSGAGLWLVSHSAAYRFLLIAANYLPAAPSNNPYYNYYKVNREALAAFERRHLVGPVKMAYLPLLHRSRPKGSGLPELNILRGEYLPARFSYDFFYVHPRAEVYRHNALALACELSSAFPGMFKTRGGKPLAVQPFVPLADHKKLDLGYFLDMVEIYRREGALPKLAAALKSKADAEPNEPEYRLTLAEIYAELGRCREALDSSAFAMNVVAASSPVQDSMRSYADYLRLRLHYDRLGRCAGLETAERLPDLCVYKLLMNLPVRSRESAYCPVEFSEQ